MTKQLIAYLLFGLFIVLGNQSFGQNVLMNYFNVNTDGSDIILEWEVQSENNVTEYRLFRKVNDETEFSYVGTVEANGSLNYQYLDDGIFKSTSQVIHYELQVVVGNKIQKFHVSVSHNPTSIQRTWGSIKSMFR